MPNPLDIQNQKELLKNSSINDYLESSSYTIENSVISSVSDQKVKIFSTNKRITDTKKLPLVCRGKIIEGLAIKILDGDTFRLFHTPRSNEREYKKDDKLLPIRLAGIDTPELSHFGRPAQNFATDAKNLLDSLIKNNKVSIEILALDGYKRILGIVKYQNSKGETVDVSTEMLKHGMACIYEGEKAVYGSQIYKYKLIKAQIYAKKKKLGIWSDTNYVSPIDFKKKTKAL